MILNIYRTVLHNLGCESLLFEFPASALEAVQKERPDIILTDLNMPDITGIDLTREIRKKFSKEKLPVVMVTKSEEEQLMEDALGKKIDGYLTKPVNPSQILSVCKSILHVKVFKKTHLGI